MTWEIDQNARKKNWKKEKKEKNEKMKAEEGGEQKNEN